MDNTQIHDLVGEITNEEIELMDGIPSYEEVYGKAVATKVLDRLIEGGAITESSRSDIVKIGNKVSCKMLLVFVEENQVEHLVASKGKTLKLPVTWTYTAVGNNKVMIEFAIK